jgi:hypothetical protein
LSDGANSPKAASPASRRAAINASSVVTGRVSAWSHACPSQPGAPAAAREKWLTLNPCALALLVCAAGPLGLAV